MNEMPKLLHSVNDPPKFQMKSAILLLVLVAASFIPCFFLWVLVGAMEASYAEVLGNQPLPMLTQLCNKYKSAILLLPMPWLVAAGSVISRGKLSDFALLTFTSTLFLALISLTVIVVVGLSFPWIPRNISLHTQ
jgi:hypothetical protein